MATGMRDVIAQLIEEASWTQRAKLLERIATRFAEGVADDAEWHAITDAFRIALYDAEPLVRRVLAETVKSAPDLPRDVLLSLARDTAAVAAPVLEHSRLLLEDDILPVVLRGMTAHRLAIASRKLISGRVAEALCRAGERTVLLRLLANEGAAIPEAVLHSLLDRFPEQPAIADAIGRRRILPVSVSSRLFGVIPPRRGESVERPALRLVAERAASA
ncbi:MAG TPA: DUF2336 domain-containing protein [Stellaceae bacterium]|nr:DUF2336 domain-containing protein [Stellaceae bacterium]